MGLWNSHLLHSCAKLQSYEWRSVTEISNAVPVVQAKIGLRYLKMNKRTEKKILLNKNNDVTYSVEINVNHLQSFYTKKEIHDDLVAIWKKNNTWYVSLVHTPEFFTYCATGLQSHPVTSHQPQWNPWERPVSRYQTYPSAFPLY